MTLSVPSSPTSSIHIQDVAPPPAPTTTSEATPRSPELSRSRSQSAMQGPSATPLSRSSSTSAMLAARNRGADAAGMAAMPLAGIQLSKDELGTMAQQLNAAYPVRPKAGGADTASSSSAASTPEATVAALMAALGHTHNQEVQSSTTAKTQTRNRQNSISMAYRETLAAQSSAESSGASTPSSTASSAGSVLSTEEVDAAIQELIDAFAQMNLNPVEYDADAAENVALPDSPPPSVHTPEPPLTTSGEAEVHTPPPSLHTPEPPVTTGGEAEVHTPPPVILPGDEDMIQMHPLPPITFTPPPLTAGGPAHDNYVLHVDSSAASTNTTATAAMTPAAARKAQVEGALAQIPTWRAHLAAGPAGVNALTNIFLSMARDGVITAMATYLREQIGHATQNSDSLSDGEKMALTGSIMGLTVALNMAAMYTQHKKGTGNAVTKACQGINIAAVTGMAAALFGTGTAGVTGALMTKSLAYAFLRDTANYVFTMDDAMDTTKAAPPLAAAAADAVPYTAIGVMTNYAQGIEGIFSGTGGTAAKLELKDAQTGLAPFSAFNGAAEGADGVIFAYLTALFQGRIKTDVDGSDVQRGGKSDVVLNLGINKDMSLQGYGEKVLGSMTARMSLLTMIFGTLGLLSKVQGLDTKESNAMFNTVLAVVASTLIPVFIGAVSTSPAPDAETRNPTTGEHAV